MNWYITLSHSCLTTQCPSLCLQEKFGLQSEPKAKHFSSALGIGNIHMVRRNLLQLNSIIFTLYLRYFNASPQIIQLFNFTLISPTNKFCSFSFSPPLFSFSNECTILIIQICFGAVHFTRTVWINYAAQPWQSLALVSFLGFLHLTSWPGEYPHPWGPCPIKKKEFQCGGNCTYSKMPCENTAKSHWSGINPWYTSCWATWLQELQIQ